MPARQTVVTRFLQIFVIDRELVTKRTPLSGTMPLVPVLSPDTSKSRHGKETKMKMILKFATAVAVTGALALARRRQVRPATDAMRPRSDLV